MVFGLPIFTRTREEHKSEMKGSALLSRNGPTSSMSLFYCSLFESLVFFFEMQESLRPLDKLIMQKLRELLRTGKAVSVRFTDASRVQRLWRVQVPIRKPCVVVARLRMIHCTVLTCASKTGRHH